MSRGFHLCFLSICEVGWPSVTLNGAWLVLCEAAATEASTASPRIIRRRPIELPLVSANALRGATKGLMAPGLARGACLPIHRQVGRLQLQDPLSPHLCGIGWRAT